MTQQNTAFLFVAGAALALSGCSSSDEAASNENSGLSGCDVVVKDADCDNTHRPIVFVHGTYGSGDNIAHVAQLFGSNGYCQDRFVAIEYNSLPTVPDEEKPALDGRLDAFIDEVLARTGADQVELMGHSQGTKHAVTYLSVPEQAAKVAHYVHLAGGPVAALPVPTLCLASQADQIATGLCPPEAEQSVVFETQDHFAVAASTDAFVAIWKYLRGEDPTYTTVQCGEETVTVEGFAESFADNVPATGKLEIREVTEPRGTPPPAVALDSTDATGHFGPLQLKRNVAYEFKGFDTQGNVIGYQYFTPFKRSNRLVRLLTPSANPLVAAASTDNIVRGPNHVAVVARWTGGAFRQDLGASLKVAGTEVLTDDNSGATALAGSLRGGVVGFFMYDANTNGVTDLGLAASGPFIAFTDVFMDASAPKFIELSFTPGSEDPDVSETKIKFSNWGSTQILLFIE